MRRTYNRQEENAYEIFDLFYEGNGVSVLMGDDKSGQKSTKDRMNSNDIRKKGRDQDHNDSNGHHQTCWRALLETPCAPREPDITPFDRDEQE